MQYKVYMLCLRDGHTRFSGQIGNFEVTEGLRLANAAMCGLLNFLGLFGYFDAILSC